MVDAVGGYDSIGFALLVTGAYLVGGILFWIPNIIVKLLGLGLFMYGGILAVGFLSFTIDSTPNLPSYSGLFPFLFMLIQILVVIKMLQLRPLRRTIRDK